MNLPDRFIADLLIDEDTQEIGGKPYEDKVAVYGLLKGSTKPMYFDEIERSCPELILIVHCASCCMKILL